MKILFFLQILFFSSTFLAAQSDTTITYLDFTEKPCAETIASKYSIRHKEGDHWKKTIFNASDDKVIYSAYYTDPACLQFDGPYTAFNKDDKIIASGLYTNNKKIGLWKGFADDGELNDSAFYKDGFIQGIALKWYPNRVISDSLIFEKEGKGLGKRFWPDGKLAQSGSFTNGKKNGQWIYNYKSGMKCQEVKYEADSAISFTCYDEEGNVKTKDCYYEKEAAFRGGDKAWMKYLSNRLSTARLPKSYSQGKIYGVAHIQFIVDSDGKIIDVKTARSANPELDDIAVDIIQKSPRWEPAIQYNRPVKAYRRQPITFSKVE